MNGQKMPKKTLPPGMFFPFGIIIGAGIGLVIGILSGNLAISPALGAGTFLLDGMERRNCGDGNGGEDEI